MVLKGDEVGELGKIENKEFRPLTQFIQSVQGKVATIFKKENNSLTFSNGKILNGLLLLTT